MYCKIKFATGVKYRRHTSFGLIHTHWHFTYICLVLKDTKKEGKLLYFKISKYVQTYTLSRMNGSL